MIEMIFDTCQHVGGYVWCSKEGLKGGKLFIFPIQAPYDTTIILEHFVD
jgi:hypothetical protein